MGCENDDDRYDICRFLRTDTLRRYLLRRYHHAPRRNGTVDPWRTSVPSYTNLLLRCFVIDVARSIGSGCGAGHRDGTARCAWFLLSGFPTAYGIAAGVRHGGVVLREEARIATEIPLNQIKEFIEPVSIFGQQCVTTAD